MVKYMKNKNKQSAAQGLKNTHIYENLDICQVELVTTYIYENVDFCQVELSNTYIYENIDICQVELFNTYIYENIDICQVELFNTYIYENKDICQVELFNTYIYENIDVCQVELFNTYIYENIDICQVQLYLLTWNWLENIYISDKWWRRMEEQCNYFLKYKHNSGHTFILSIYLFWGCSGLRFGCCVRITSKITWIGD